MIPRDIVWILCFVGCVLFAMDGDWLAAIGCFCATIIGFVWALED